MKLLPMLPTDARLYQILFLSLFLLVGIFTRDWTWQPGIIAIATCLITQIILQVSLFNVQSWQDKDFNKDFNFNTQLQTLKSSIPSALITSLGLSLLLRVDHYSTLILAGAVGISSKFLFRVQDKHIFNPANFGMITALLLTPDAWVSPGRWGEEGWYAVLFVGAGGLVLRRVGRWDTTIAFLGSYAGLEAVRNLWLGWTWDVWAHRLMSGSLLLFALFMVTDPRSIPNSRTGRMIWAMAIALLTFVLRNYFFMSDAVFWALFFLSPLTLLIDFCLPSDRFSWTEASTPTVSIIPNQS
jgi:Na+-transporting NADH:ubiquinone oxidoreductase subunit NqrB